MLTTFSQCLRYFRNIYFVINPNLDKSNTYSGYILITSAKNSRVTCIFSYIIWPNKVRFKWICP